VAINRIAYNNAQEFLMLLNSKINSPATFAEHYIVESIWKNHFPPGSLLPAERELSDLIGITRTTLREVLQRLSRDGWLTIQHGKATKVNDYWQTSSLNILDTLARLDDLGSLQLVRHLLETRTTLFALYLRATLKKDPQSVIKYLAEAINLQETSDDFVDYDWQLMHQVSQTTENPIYTLILNGFKTLYLRVGKYYFSFKETRSLALEFYNQLKTMIEEDKDIEIIISFLWQYGRDSGDLFKSLRDDMPSLSSLGDD
jgi:GntR family negative regulator for fad regulon and positive regulator of fabA